MSAPNSDRRADMPNNVSNLITRKEAAKRSGKSISTIRAWIRDGVLNKHVKNPKKKNSPVYVDWLELQQFLVLTGKKPTTDMQSKLTCQNQNLEETDRLKTNISKLEKRLKESQDIEKELRVKIQQLETDMKLSDMSKEQELTDLRQDKAFLRGQIEKKDEQIARIEQKIQSVNKFLTSKWWLRTFVAPQLLAPQKED